MRPRTNIVRGGKADSKFIEEIDVEHGYQSSHVVWDRQVRGQVVAR
jgi:hypothetical protein